MTAPTFADVADDYLAAGFGPLPIPAESKAFPPSGTTGRDAAMPTEADVAGWIRTQGLGNIAVRLPDGVIGIDVDDYDGKRAAATLAEREASLGALPPTVMTSSRIEGVSGIRLYRVPQGSRFPGKVGEAIDVVQNGHRYAMCWPSIHPEGRVYRWLDSVTREPVDGIPQVSDLPDLPAAWLDWLASHEVAARGEYDEDYTARLTTGEPPAWLADALSDFVDVMASGTGRHPAALAFTGKLAVAIEKREPGTRDLHDRALEAYLDAHPGEPGALDAWRRLWPGAIGHAAETVAAEREREAATSIATWRTAPQRPERSGAGGALQGGADEGEHEGTKTLAARVVDYVLAHFWLGASSEGKLIATPRYGPQVSRTLSALKQPVSAGMYRDLGILPSAKDMSAAFLALEGLASEADPVTVHLRSAHDPAEGAVFIDLGDADKTILRVDADGWQDANGVTPVFRRSASVRPLPRPVRVDDRDAARTEFASALRLSIDSSAFRRVWGWLVMAWLDDIARPLLWARGEQGSGKTTRARMVLNLIDPADALGGAPGRSERDDSTGAAGRYVATYDNVRTISDATSDWICRLITGVSLGRRALFTDDGVFISTLRRTGLATSIVLPYGLGPDAVERLIDVPLGRIPDTVRQTEGDLWAEYEAMRPRVLGALLDDLAGVLRCLPDVQVATLPRMADYGKGLHALDLATGGQYASAYLEACAEAMSDAVDSDPWLAAVVELARRGAEADETIERPISGRITEMQTDRGEFPAAGKWIRDGWEGTAADLVSALDRLLGDPTGKHPGARGIRGALLNKATPLRAAGVTVGRRKSGVWLLSLHYVEPEPDDMTPARDVYALTA